MIPLTPHGKREMLAGTILLLSFGLILGLWHRSLSLLVLPVLIWLFAFFRDPERAVPADSATMVSPADGVVSDITHIENDPIIGGPAVRVGIFLSVFNVHVNRVPCDGVVVNVVYKEGKFINAMSHSKASDENESNTIIIREPNGERNIAVVKQIVGLIARLMISWLWVGVPLAWGVSQTVIKSTALFENPAPSTSK